jgi:hypothetical protein
MARRSRKRSSSAGSEKMKRVGDRWGKMEKYFLTGQSPLWAVAPTQEEEVKEDRRVWRQFCLVRLVETVVVDVSNIHVFLECI